MLRKKFAAAFRDKRKLTLPQSPPQCLRNKRGMLPQEPPVSALLLPLRLRLHRFPPLPLQSVFRRRPLLRRRPRRSLLLPPHRMLVLHKLPRFKRPRRQSPLHRLPRRPHRRNQLPHPRLLPPQRSRSLLQEQHGLQLQQFNVPPLPQRLRPNRHPDRSPCPQLRTVSLCAQRHKAILALRPRSVPFRPANSGRVSQELPDLRLALLPGPALNRNVLCPPAIAALFPPAIVDLCQPAIEVPCLPVIAPAARVLVSPCVPVSRCVRNKVDQAGKVVPILRVLPDPVVLAVRKIVLTASAPVQLRPAHVPVHANPVGPECFRLPRRTKCRRAPSPASRSIPAARRNASDPAPISARWKASASSIQLGSAPVQAIAVL